MSREEIQKLLGGYATGTLTAEEQRALFAAALEDQELFDALEREQSLRDLLSDPAARAHLLAALDAPGPAPWVRRWWRPLSVAAMAVALASIAIVAVRRHPPAAPPAMVAKLGPPVVPPVVAAPPPAPAPVRAEPSPVRNNTPTLAQLKKSPPVDMARMAPAPAPPPVAAPSAPKDAAPKEKGEVAVSAGAQTVEVKSAAVSLSKAQGFRDLPVATRNAVTGAAIAEAKTTAAPADASALFYDNVFMGARGGLAAGGGGGRGGAVGGIGSGASAEIRPLAKSAPAAPAGHLGIQYRILRMTASGEFLEADSAATDSVAAGTLFRLKITANDSGYLRILQEAPDGAWRETLNHAVERMQPIETEPIELDRPGRVRFHVAFARQPLPPSNVAQPDDDIVVDRGRVVTVAGRAAAQQLSFNITLTVQ
jgi:hypothetical protein